MNSSRISRIMCITALTTALGTGLVATPGCAFWHGGSRGEAVREIEEGERLVSMGLTDDALAAFERAIELSPELPRAHMGVAQIYQVQGDYEGAERAYAEAARLQPSNFDAHYGRGLMLQLLDRLNEAVRAYLRAVQLRPDDAPTHFNLAAAYIQLGEPDQALPYAERATQLDPGNGAGHLNLGMLYLDLDRPGDALYAFESAAPLLGPDPKLLRNMAEAQGKLKQYERMRETIVELLGIEQDAAAWERLGYARFKSRQYAAALDAFEQSLEMDENYIPALNGVGVCMLNAWLVSEQEDEEAHDRGIAMLRRSVQLDDSQTAIINLLHRYE
jgi:tetratricopeptide (TPR) repeat protein